MDTLRIDDVIDLNSAEGFSPSESCSPLKILSPNVHKVRKDEKLDPRRQSMLMLNKFESQASSVGLLNDTEIAVGTDEEVLVPLAKAAAAMPGSLFIEPDLDDEDFRFLRANNDKEAALLSSLSSRPQRRPSTDSKLPSPSVGKVPSSHQTKSRLKQPTELASIVAKKAVSPLTAKLSFLEAHPELVFRCADMSDDSTQKVINSPPNSTAVDNSYRRKTARERHFDSWNVLDL